MPAFSPSSVPQTPSYGVAVDGKVFVWSEALDQKALAQKKMRRTARDAVNGMALVLCVLCLLWFGWSAYLSQMASVWAALWRPSAVGFSLSLTLLFGAFVFQRISEVARRRHVVPQRDRGDELPAVASPVPEGERANVADLYHSEAMRAVEEAYELATRFGHAAVLPLHLFIATLSHGDVPVVFGRLGIRFEDVREPLNRRLLAVPVGAGPSMSPEAEQSLMAAFVNAYAQHRTSVSATEVFFEAYRHDAFVRELFYDLKVDEARLANVVEWIRISDALRERYEQFRRAAAFKPTGNMNRSMTAVQTQALDAVGEDLTAAAVAGRLPLLVGREQEMEELFRVIEGGGRSVVLVGPEGVGKTAVV